VAIPDEWLAAELGPKRVDHERELRQDKIPFAHAERVYVRGSLSGERGDDRLSSRPLIDAEEAVLAPTAEFQHVGVMATSGAVEVRVGNGDRPLDPLVITVPAERVQRVRVEANRHPRFGAGDDLAGQLGELVQHGQPVEPVVVPPVTHLELRWSGPHQGAGKPGRDRTSDGQVVQASFRVQSTESQVIWRPAHGWVSRYAFVTCVRGGIERAGYVR
jgi:hypothetical protein